MKRSLKNVLAIVLAATLLLLLLAGCADESTPVAENADEAAVTDAPASAENPAETEDPPLQEREPEANVQPAPTEPEPAPEGTILSIYGDGVESQTNWTLEQLKELEAGYLEITYSTTRNWPTYSHMVGHGVSLRYLLEQAGLLDSAKTLVFSAPDGYRATITREQIFETRFSYTEHSMEHSSGAVEVPPMIAWEWGDIGDVSPEEIRPLFGQRGPHEVNTASSVKDLFRIEVLTWDAGAWEVPGVSIPSGSTVPVGTELELTHPLMDNTGLYYTMDGSAPDFYSTLYNVSTSYFQPELIVPIIIGSNVTIKVFAGGLGKADSEIVTFTYTVE